MSTLARRAQNGDRDPRVDEVRQRGDRVAVAFSWSDAQGGRHTWAHILRLRSGLIVDMQDHASAGRALRAVR